MLHWHTPAAKLEASVQKILPSGLAVGLSNRYECRGCTEPKGGALGLRQSFGVVLCRSAALGSC